MRLHTIVPVVFAAALLVAGGTAEAQEAEPEISLDLNEDIELGNLVISAAKEAMTVQEAPSIITIVTDKDIKRHGYKWLREVLATVPGWLDSNAFGNAVATPLVRGVGQGLLLLHDGVSMFEPAFNFSWVGRTQPLENLKRIEVVTGPGGTLWGANSFLGVVNLITKDAEDVDGVEVSAAYGEGPGNKHAFKAYGMFGRSFLKGKIKLFQHVSYETYLGEVFDIPQVLYPRTIGANRPVDPERSWQVIVDGKYTFGPFTLYYMLPFGERYPNLGFNNIVTNRTRWDTYDRYGILAYEDRFFKDRFKLSVKGYAVQFVRNPILEYALPSSVFPVGTRFDVGHEAKNLRFGGTLDTILTLPLGFRILTGGEAYYEMLYDAFQRYYAPEDATGILALCPVDAAGNVIRQCPHQLLKDSSRTVVAGYTNLQWRFRQRLTIEGGIRLQAGLGQYAYALKPLYSAAVVWNVFANYHIKAEYAEGFRPPVYNYTSSVPGGTNLAGAPNLKSEDSRAFQTEFNTRVLRNVRPIRELELRVAYSYTVLTNLIQVVSELYVNAGKRAIHSVEGHAKLFLEGGHVLRASYTYLHSTTNDLGEVRTIPRQWFTLGAAFNLVENILDLNTNLTVLAPYEEPNPYLFGATLDGQPIARQREAGGLTIDRLTPVALLQLGFRLRFFKERLAINGQFYNVLNQHYNLVNGVYDVSGFPGTPTPAPGFNFYGSVSYRF